MARTKETAEVEVKLSVADAEAKIKTLSKDFETASAALKKMGADDPGRVKAKAEIAAISKEVVELNKSIKKDLTVVIDGREADANIKELKLAQSQLTREMETFRDKTDPIYKFKAEQLATITTRLKELQAPIIEAKKSFVTLGEDGSMTALKDRATKLRAEIDLLAPASTRFTTALAELNGVDRSIQEITTQTKLARAEFAAIGQDGSFNQLTVKAEALQAELAGMAVGTQEYIDKSKQLAGVEISLDQIKNDAAQLKLELKGIGADDSLDGLKLKADRLRSELNKLSPATAEFTKKKTDLQAVEIQIEEITTATKAAKVEFTEIGQIGSFTFMKAKAEALRKEIDLLAPSTREFIAKSRELQQVESKMDSLNNTIKGSNGLWSKLGDSVKQFGLLAAGYLGFQAITSQIQNVIAKNAQLSDSIADVMQTTGLTADEVKRLSKEFNALDTRTSRKELLDIVKVAGQFGVAKDDLLGFTAAVNKASVVLSSEFKGGAEEITTTIAGLRNVLRDIKTDKIDQDILHISNGLIVLAQQGVATAPVVADFANRIGGIGISLGLTTDQVLGLSATLQELSVSTERGGTAIGKILQKMTQNTKEFAEVAGYDGSAGKNLKDFEKLVNTDIYSAFLKFVEGSKRGGQSAIAFSNILKDSEISGAGASEVIAKLGSNIDLLQNRVALSGKAIKETTAITEQYTVKNENFAAQLEKLLKKLNAYFTSPEAGQFFARIVGGINEMLDATPAFDKLKDQFDALSAGTKSLETNITPLLKRYDELKSKTTLTTAEQTELKHIVDEVSQSVPIAVSKFDEYGKALELNTTRARDFIDAQQKLTAFKNVDAIKAGESALKNYESNIRVIQEALNKIATTGNKTVFDEARQADVQVKASNEDVKLLSEKLGDLQEKAKGTYLSLKELKGLPVVDDRDSFKFQQEGSGYKPTATKPFEIKNSNSTNNTTTNVIENKVTTTVSVTGDEEAKKKIKEYEETVRAHQARMEQLYFDLENLHVAVIKDDGAKSLAALDVRHEQEIAKNKKTLDEIQRDEKLSAAQKAEEKTAINAVAAAKEAQYQEERVQLVKKYNDQLAEEEFKADLKNLDKWVGERKLAITNSFNEGKLTKQEYETALVQLEAQAAQYRLAIQKDYGKSTVEIEQAIADKIAGVHKDELQEFITNEVLKHKKAGELDEFAQIKALKARKAAIEEERDMKLKAAGNDAAAIIKINADADEAILATDKEILLLKIKLYEDHFSKLWGAFQNFSNAISNRENAELSKDKRKNDALRNNYKKQLDDKLISQEEYDNRINKLNDQQQQKEAAVKKKQFERNKKLAIAEATIQGIVSVVKTLAQYSYPANLIFAALDAIVVGAEIANISSQPAPEYGKGKAAYVMPGKGGVPQGPSHKEGGIDLIDTKTKEKLGNMEGNEPILSESTYLNNKPLVDKLLDSSLNKGGEKIKVTPEEITSLFKNGGFLNPPAAVNKQEQNVFENYLNSLGAVLKLELPEEVKSRLLGSLSLISNTSDEKTRFDEVFKLQRSADGIAAKGDSNVSSTMQEFSNNVRLLVSTTTAISSDQKGLVNKYAEMMKALEITGTQKGLVNAFKYNGDAAPDSQKGLVNRNFAGQFDAGKNDFAPGTQKGLVNLIKDGQPGGPDSQKGLVNRNFAGQFDAGKNDFTPGTQKGLVNLNKEFNPYQDLLDRTDIRSITAVPKFTTAPLPQVNADRIRENIAAERYRSTYGAFPDQVKPPVKQEPNAGQGITTDPFQQEMLKAINEMNVTLKEHKDFWKNHGPIEATVSLQDWKRKLVIDSTVRGNSRIG